METETQGEQPPPPQKNKSSNSLIKELLTEPKFWAMIITVIVVVVIIALLNKKATSGSGPTINYNTHTKKIIVKPRPKQQLKPSSPKQMKSPKQQPSQPPQPTQEQKQQQEALQKQQQQIQEQTTGTSGGMKPVKAVKAIKAIPPSSGSEAFTNYYTRVGNYGQPDRNPLQNGIKIDDKNMNAWLYPPEQGVDQSHNWTYGYLQHSKPNTWHKQQRDQNFYDQEIIQNGDKFNVNCTI